MPFQNRSCHFRDGYKTFFNTLSQNSVPLFIFSAGVGDILEEIMRQRKVFHPNIHIVSNYMEFDEDVSWGWKRGGDRQPGCFTLNVNPDGGGGREGMPASLPSAVIYLLVPAKDSRF